MHKSSQLVFILLSTLAASVAALPLSADDEFLVAREPYSDDTVSDLTVRKVKFNKGAAKKAGKIALGLGGAALGIAGAAGVPGASAGSGLLNMFKGWFRRNVASTQSDGSLQARDLDQETFEELFARFLESEEGLEVRSELELEKRGFRKWVKKQAKKVGHAVSQVNPMDVLNAAGSVIGAVSGARTPGGGGGGGLFRREEPFEAREIQYSYDELD